MSVYSVACHFGVIVLAMPPEMQKWILLHASSGLLCSTCFQVLQGLVNLLRLESTVQRCL